VTSELENARLQLDEKHQGLLKSRGFSDQKDVQLKSLADKVSNFCLL